MKSKEFTTVLTSEDKIDVKLAWENNKLWRFVINYRASIKDKWHEVYRVDNYHGFLHEQKFWRSPKPIIINDKEGWSLKMVFDYYIEEVYCNFQDYKKYYEHNLNKNRTERADENERKDTKKRVEKKS
jgi:hypothetical protein